MATELTAEVLHLDRGGAHNGESATSLEYVLELALTKLNNCHGHPNGGTGASGYMAELAGKVLLLSEKNEEAAHFYRLAYNFYAGLASDHATHWVSDSSDGPHRLTSYTEDRDRVKEILSTFPGLYPGI